jgi:transposase
MKRFVEGTDRGQSTLFPECLEDWIDENNPVQVIDVFVDALDLAELGFDGDGSKFKAVNNRDKNYTREFVENAGENLSDSVSLDAT